MSTEVSTYLRALAAAYLVAGRPSHKTWYFDAGEATSVHAQLVALGLLLKVLGTEKGFAWRLTDAGFAALSAKTTT